MNIDLTVRYIESKTSVSVANVLNFLSLLSGWIGAWKSVAHTDSKRILYFLVVILICSEASLHPQFGAWVSLHLSSYLNVCQIEIEKVSKYRN